MSIVNPVATIGIFDGVHLAHKEIIKKLKNTAAGVSGESLIVTLWPHPRIVLSSNSENIKLINTMDEKIELLDKAGVDNLVILSFNEELAAMGFEEFARKILFEKLQIHHLVVGYNHQFGKNREGNFLRLQELSARLGFSIEQVDPVIVNEERVSSTTIRKLISEGKVEEANLLLGYNFYLSGTIVTGNKLGRKIGFPTANISSYDPHKLIPGNGVYCVWFISDGKSHEAMMNIGYRPTVEQKNINLVLEANLLDYSGDLYNKNVQIVFIKKIRDEQKFNSLDELKAQLAEDKMTTVHIFESLKKY